MSRIRYPSSCQTWLRQFGKTHKIIGPHDSGNISYCIETEVPHNYYIKFAPFENQEALRFLENAYILGKTVKHPVLPVLEFSVYCSDGLALVYDWVEGETLNEVTTKDKSREKELREKPSSPYRRFKALSVEKIIRVLNQIFDLHLVLEQKGYVSCDWYDGCIIYNFSEDELHIIDLDVYNNGSFYNTMGRMYGSSRFMAPEEFCMGEIIDYRTSVYHMGATVFELLGTGKETPNKDFRGSQKILELALKAIQDDKEDRFSSVQEFYAEWQTALA